MRVTVLGGAAAWPNAGQGCSAYLVQSGAQSILIDCGSGAVQELRKHVDYTAIDAILISHFHSDHVLDLVAYRYGLLYGVRQKSRQIPVWLPPGGLERMRMLGDAFDGQGERYDTFWDAAFDLREYDPESPLELGSITMTFAPTQHFIECYAMRLEHSTGRVVAYSADTGAIEGLVELFTGADLGIIEATLEAHGETPLEWRGHLTPEDAGRLAALARVDRLVLTHLWQERSEDAVVAGARTEFDRDIRIATPGLILRV